MQLPEKVLQTLERLQKEGRTRSLKPPSDGIDFSSNDYLGMASWRPDPAQLAGLDWGSSGSRLLSGNHSVHEELEAWCADFFRAERALLFGSGFLANVGTISALCGPGDRILYDQYLHASLRDAVKLSGAEAHAFAHNDLRDLESRLTSLPPAEGSSYVLVESLYSMDGDFAPLKALADLCERAGAWLIVDEAHSTGLIGPQGSGLTVSQNQEHRILYRIHTFGKAVGREGAVVLGPEKAIDFLLNRARSFIFSTAPGPRRTAELALALKHSATLTEDRLWVYTLVKYFRDLFPHDLPIELAPSASPIMPILCPGNETVMALAEHLQSKGYDCRGIRYPSVPKGKERLRVILHAFNTEAEIEGLIAELQGYFGQG